MKKLLFALALICISMIAAQAQPYTSLTINNNTNCTVYMVIDGNVAAGTCSPNYQSGILGISPGSTTFTDASTVPGGMNNGGLTLTSGDQFVAIEIHSTEPIASNGCSPRTSYYMSDCSGGMLTSTMMNFDHWNGSTCNSCTVGSNVTLSGSGSTLTINIM